MPIATPVSEKASATPVHTDDFALLKGQFLASLNHELRTPLTGVIGMVDLMLETHLDNEQREFAETIRTCAAQLLDTVNAVLDYSALAAGKVRIEEAEFQLGAGLSSVVAELRPRAAEKGLIVNADLDSSLPESVVGDERLLRQLLLHLLRNAVKFTNRGSVELRAWMEHFDDGKAWIGITVNDTGIGIPPEKLKLIFESFRQLDGGLSRTNTGLGLGLALTDKIVRALGGEISVSSQPGAGSTFRLRLPFRLTESVVQHVNKPPTVTPVSRLRTSRRILVVDDSTIARDIVSHLLIRAGFSVTLADNGVAAVEKAASGAFDLILMDLQMPGMDGLSTTLRLRQLPGYESKPIVALTANDSDEDRQKCLQHMQGFLSKPVERDQLVALLNRLTGASNPTPSNP